MAVLEFKQQQIGLDGPVIMFCLNVLFEELH